MASGPRRKGETFEDYRARLKGEELSLRTRLRGMMRYISREFLSVPDESAEKIPFMKQPMKQVSRTAPPLVTNRSITRKAYRAARNQ